MLAFKCSVAPDAVRTNARGPQPSMLDESDVSCSQNTPESSCTAAAESSLTVTDTAMRVCGGAAFRKEAGIERLFRDARASSVMAPTSDVLYDFIGKAITGLPLF